MEEDEYGLTRGTCFVARRLEVGRGGRAAVDFVMCFFFRSFSSNAHGLLQV